MFGLGMVPLPFLLVGGWNLAGVAIGLSYGVQLLPAVVASLRTRVLSGVSSTTWIIALSEAAGWLVYGLGVGDIALTLAGAVGAVMASVILARLADHRTSPVRRARPASTDRTVHRNLTWTGAVPLVGARWTIAQPSLAS